MSIQPVSGPAYEDFQPPSDWDHDRESDTLILMLPGFRKEQLKVQVSSNRILRVSGERKISDYRWRRFRTELPVSENNETSGISAKFEAGMLYVKIPKIMKPPTQQQPPKPTTDPKPDAEPADVDKTVESKPEPQTPHLQEPKAEENDSQEKTEIAENENEKEKEKEKAETDDANNNKTYNEIQETHGSTEETALQEQKTDHEVSEKESKKEKEVETNSKEEIAEAVRSQTQETHGMSDEEYLSMRSVVGNIKKRYSSTVNMLSGLVKEAKKQNKLANLVVAIFLVLLIGLYIKNVVKSSFRGTGANNQEF